jgi:hypothetical protein
VTAGHNDFFKRARVFMFVNGAGRIWTTVVGSCADRSHRALTQYQPQSGGAEANCIPAH